MLGAIAFRYSDSELLDWSWNCVLVPVLGAPVLETMGIVADTITMIGVSNLHPSAPFS